MAENPTPSETPDRTTVAGLGAGSWRVVREASAARFSVKDKVVLTVHGTIPITSGWAELDGDQRVVRAVVELDASRIDTGNTRRDRDLSKPRFLDTGSHPRVVVDARSTSTRPDGWHLVGTVAARQAEAPIELEADLAGDDSTGVRAHVAGRLDRQPLGMRVPGFVVGRHLDLDVDLVLVPEP